jgi:sugar lactone lactonase YvrE
MRKVILAILILIVPTAIALSVYFLVKPKNVPTMREAIGQVATLAGAGHPGTDDGASGQASFADPFGIAVDSHGFVYVADGGQSNRIRRISPSGNVETIAGSTEGYRDGPALSASFNTPSGLCIDKDGNILIADTANNRIRKIDVNGRVTTVAGDGEAGFKDGPAAQAQFDGPVGVAVDGEGNIFVADTYNDKVRKISKVGEVSTVAGAASPGYTDGWVGDALLDTPCGVAVDGQGNLFVADTGNRAVRKITPQGEVITIAGGSKDGGDVLYGGEVHYSQPTGIAVTHDGFLFVSDADSHISQITPEGEYKYYAGWSPGFADKKGWDARFNRPAGVAVDREGNVYVADGDNYLIRLLTPVARDRSSTEPDRFVWEAYVPGALLSEEFIQPAAESLSTDPDSVIPKLNARTLNIGQSFPWPLGPQDRWHEVTGVVGEARGTPRGDALHHLHSGLDIRGNMGDAVVSALDEKVSSPLAAWGFGGSFEGIHVGLMSYIHIRVGRNAKDEVEGSGKFKPRFDESGKLSEVRVRRGTRFRVGDLLGTLNSLYHLHLNLGPWNAQANPIQFPFPAFRDTVAPTIEPNGIEVVNMSGQPFKEKREGRLVITGDVDILVTSYDQVTGNVKSRKLGLYKVGYQLLKEDGSKVEGFDQPLFNIEFNRMPAGDPAVFKVYAEGSGVSAYGTPTRFKYIVTNYVRDGVARDGLLRTSVVGPGNYILRVLAEDYAGNRASGKATELPVVIN